MCSQTESTIQSGIVRRVIHHKHPASAQTVLSLLETEEKYTDPVSTIDSGSRPGNKKLLHPGPE
jgi:hypothetical protein